MDNQAEKDGQAQETSPLSEKEKEQRRVITLLKLETLKRVDLFSQFSESALRLLAKDCNDRLVKKGEALCVEGAVETSMYVILSGEFEIYKLQKKVDVAVSGEYFGEMVLIDSQPRSATVRATTDSMVMQIDAEVFTKHIMDDPVHFFSMIKTLSLRARHLLDVISQDFQTMNCFVHDMRNILSALDLPELYLDTFTKRLAESEEEQAKEDLRKVDKSLKKIASVRNNLITLIEKSLMVAKNCTTEYVKKKEPILPLMHEITEELEGHKSLKGKNMKITTKGNIGEVLFNTLDIKRVMQNLIINAGYVSDQNATVNIVIKDKGNEIQVSVVDQGCGIPDDVKPHLLKSRYTTKSDGNGFGLLSCRDIVEDCHQGNFWFDSEVGKGDGISFYFAQLKGQPRICRTGYLSKPLSVHPYSIFRREINSST